MNSLPVFIISLSEATKRQDHMRQQMDRQGITNYEFFTAIDGRAFDVPNHPIYNKDKRRLFFGRDLKGGELGVLLSHKALYQKIIDENIDRALIFEDDAMLDDHFKNALSALLKTDYSYDLVRFLGSKKVMKLQQYTVCYLQEIYKLNRLRTSPGGAFAYVITQRGAEKMLKLLDQIFLPIDTLMGHGWKNSLNALVMSPGLAEQDQSQEQYIGTARFEKTLDIDGIMRFLFPLMRGWFKLSEAVMKMLNYMVWIIKDRFL